MIFKNDLQKRCFDFSLTLLSTSTHLRKHNKNWILLDQVVRSGTSIGANIIEGSNSTSKKEFVHYLQISLKSAAETCYWLELLKEINESEKNSLSSLIAECQQLKKIISTIILNTRANLLNSKL